MDEKLNSVALRVKKLTAYTDCCNLMGSFMVYLSQGKMAELIGLWAQRDDSLYAGVWGCYEGIRSVERCFMLDHGDRRDPRSTEAYKGYFNYQGINGEYVVVADDLQTARGKWKCEGIVNFGKEVLDAEYKNRGYWNYSGYCADFIFENGAWKIWHMRVVPMIWAPYDKVWGDCTPYSFYPVRKSTEDKPPMAPIFNYSYECDFAGGGFDAPIPKPYGSWEEVAPGYSYKFQEVAK